MELVSKLKFATVVTLPGGAVKGDALVKQSDGHLYVYDGAAWIDTGAAGGSAPDPLPVAINTQAHWYIHAISGSDANDGLTTGTALATWAELGRRINGRRYPQEVVIHLLSDTPTTDPIFLDSVPDAPSGWFRITGADGIQYTNRTAISFTPLNPATNTQASITYNVAPTVGMLLRFSNGAYAWVTKVSGGVAYLDAPCIVEDIYPAFAGYPSTTDPPTLSYQEVRLPKASYGSIHIRQYQNSNCYLLIDAIDFQGTYDAFEPYVPTMALAAVTRCRFRGLFVGMNGCAGGLLIKSYVEQLISTAPGTLDCLWSTFRQAEVYAGAAASGSFRDCTFPASAGGSRYNEALKVMPGAFAHVQNCGFFDGVSNGIVISANATLRALGAIYGSGNGGKGVLMGAGSALTLSQRPTLAATTGDYGYTDSTDTAAKTWAGITLNTAPQLTLVTNPPAARGQSVYVQSAVAPVPSAANGPYLLVTVDGADIQFLVEDGT
jgi:hypothetical protein